MTAKDYVAIIDTIADTPRVKTATKKTILHELAKLFMQDNPNFKSERYWSYINSRLEMKQ